MLEAKHQPCQARPGQQERRAKTSQEKIPLSNTTRWLQKRT